MRTVRTVSELRAALNAPRRAQQTIALVPTMGALHDGHRALMRHAATLCDVVVVSLFVNPTQFAPGEDLDAYPRDEPRDAEIAAETGVDLLFAPATAEVYPDGFATTVTVAGELTDVLEGVSRGAEHFAAVTTVVLKLLNIVDPEIAVFGQKDAQQAAVVRRMVRDLDVAVRIEVCPTVRDGDGLALSSRNAYMSESERERALALKRALEAAEREVAGGERDAGHVAACARGEMSRLGVEPEYVELVDPQTMRPLSTLNGEALLALAARVGRTRLIDNTLLRTASSKTDSTPS